MDSQEDWVEINHPENLLFGFLGAWLAFMLGLSLYSNEIQQSIQQSRSPHPARNPAALGEIPSLIRSKMTPTTDASVNSKPSTLDGIPAEAWLPILY